MAEEIKRKRGRPPKKIERRGGRREGAGRKKTENPKCENVTFRVSEITLSQIRQLRELTKTDEVSFNEMFVQWVDEIASTYGIE